jgi:transposase
MTPCNPTSGKSDWVRPCSSIRKRSTSTPPVPHGTSWWGRCPPQRVSGGKVLRRRTTSWAHRAATALRRAAAALPHRQSAVGAFCRRLQARLGAPKAITATAHTLARLIDTMLKHGTASVRRGMDA